MNSTINPLILDVLGWTHEEYCLNQYESGLKQISTLSANPNEFLVLESSAVFWSAFKAHWMRMDQEFLESMRMDMMTSIIVEGNPCTEEVIDSYHSFHGFETMETLPVAVQKAVNNQLYIALKEAR